MTIILIILVIMLFAAMALAIFDLTHPSRCKNCGTKMNRYYDADEDAEVWQCPVCGRSYLIK